MQFNLTYRLDSLKMVDHLSSAMIFHCSDIVELRRGRAL